jgi:hypothetical protein
VWSHKRTLIAKAILSNPTEIEHKIMASKGWKWKERGAMRDIDQHTQRHNEKGGKKWCTVNAEGDDS